MGLRALILRVKNPSLETILKALQPLADEALFAAENRALEVLRATETEISELDQKAIADAYYALIPESINIGGRTISLTLIKVIITKEIWATFVQRLFDEAMARIKANEMWLAAQITTPLPIQIKAPQASPSTPQWITGSGSG
jgi:hypothetical protein